MRNYRRLFIAAIVAILALAAAFATYVNVQRAVLRRAAEAARDAARTRAAVDPPPATPAEDALPPLAPIELTPQRTQEIGVRTAIVRYENVQNTISASGNVSVDETLESSVHLRFAGWISKVFVNSTFQFVRTGEPLFTVYSPALVSAEQDYLLAKRNSRRLRGSAVPGVAEGAASLVSASAERLLQWGIAKSEISRLDRTKLASREITYYSPVSGYVTERDALPHTYAQPSTTLYKITGLSPVWVYADVFQNEIGQVRVGDPATVTVDSYPGREFHGRVDFIWPQVDPATRTVKVRLAFANPGLKLMPGMYVNVSMTIPLGRHLVIPASAVLQSGLRQTAFVELGSGEIAPRQVELGARAGNEFIVLKGLKAGERIVTSATFLIDSESQLQAALGSFAPPPPGAGEAAAINQAHAAVQFSTVPATPRKGANQIQIRLADSHGKPISGASVEATFFMSAMPAMGMSAMRVQAECADRGGGLYQGSITLPIGGAWKVSVVARKAGQTIAATQITVNATGGM